MNGNFHVSRRDCFARIFWVGALVIVILSTYQLLIAETNAYLGYMSFAIDLPYLSTLLVSLFILVWFIPVRVTKPSDFFRLLYGSLALLPYVVLHGIRGEVEPTEYMMNFCVLMLPMFAVQAGSFFMPALRVPAFFGQNQIIWILTFLCVLGLFNVFAVSTSSAGFSINDVYDRRLEGREIFPDRSFFAYLNSAVVNGFAPLLAFIAGWRRRNLLFLFAIVCVLGYYYVLGFKAPVLFVLLSYAMGWMESKNKLELTGRFFWLLLLALFALFMIEYVFSGFSLVGDYFFRRVYGVTAFLSASYFDFINISEVSAAWSALDGIDATEPITFIVGETFLGAPGLNANTNTFLYALAGGGIVGFGATVLLVVMVFCSLDAVYRSKKNPILLYLGFLYGVLLMEQAATTALVSSGIGLLIVFFFFSVAQKEKFSG